MYGELLSRIHEPRRFIQLIAGPRQVGKTTLVRQVLAAAALPVHVATADDPGLPGRGWIDAQWEVARIQARSSGAGLLVLDEVQKIAGWSEVVKRLWTEDGNEGLDLRVILLGSAPLLMQRGIGETLAGRFELTRLGHWSFREMHEAFEWSLDTYLFFGGYPGAAPLVADPERWRRYVLDSLVETAISRDILLLTRIDKPALLRQLFRLACDYSAQAVAYTKLVGQLRDAGNTTTLAHYLELLRQVGLATGLERYSGSRVRQRGSSPKLLMLNTALMTSMSGHTPDTARADPAYWGRLVETAVGAHLVNTSDPAIEVSWWRDRGMEVDYVVSSSSVVAAVEVASGRTKPSLPGLQSFTRAYPKAKPVLIGSGGLPLEQALTLSAASLLHGVAG